MTTTTTPAAKPADRPAIRAAMRGVSPVPATSSARPAPAGSARVTAEPAVSTVAAYGLRQPSVVDARASIERIYGSIEADAIWNELTGPALGAAHRAVTLEEIVSAMLASRHDVVRLCGQALQIRVRSYTHLSAAQTIVS